MFPYLNECVHFVMIFIFIFVFSSLSCSLLKELTFMWGGRESMTWKITLYDEDEEEDDDVGDDEEE